MIDSLAATKAADVAGIVASLNTAQLDILMKYIYRGFEKHDASAGALLAWHEKVVEAGGLGTIVRVLTARKTV